MRPSTTGRRSLTWRKSIGITIRMLLGQTLRGRSGSN